MKEKDRLPNGITSSQNSIGVVTNTYCASSLVAHVKSAPNVQVLWLDWAWEEYPGLIAAAFLVLKPHLSFVELLVLTTRLLDQHKTVSPSSVSH